MKEETFSHPQSVTELNYAKAIPPCFEARALIPSSPPASGPCQIQPSSEILANQSWVQSFPSDACWKPTERIQMVSEFKTASLISILTTVALSFWPICFLKAMQWHLASEPSAMPLLMFYLLTVRNVPRWMQLRGTSAKAATVLCGGNQHWTLLTEISVFILVLWRGQNCEG